jgi:hypothetical protein
MHTLDFDEVDPVVGVSINQARQEVDDACADMETFVNREPDEIMRLAAGHSARLSTIRIRIMRIEDFRREWRDVRVRTVEPCLEQLDKQWAHGSRLHSVREFDWRVETGER